MYIPMPASSYCYISNLISFRIRAYEKSNEAKKAKIRFDNYNSQADC